MNNQYDLKIMNITLHYITLEITMSSSVKCKSDYHFAITSSKHEHRKHIFELY